ncbi:MAG: M20/M25/M40 family metallo-hydrolase, partial [Comamonadaceae bacterium]
MARWLRMVGTGLGVVVLGLVVVVLVITWLLPGLPPAGAKQSPPITGLDAALGRLSAAVQIRTVSYGPASSVKEDNSPAFHKLLQDSFPLIHAALKREIVNGSSLLYTWQGSDPSLAPVLLTAHFDVVPVEPGTEANWTHPPFSGAVADGYVWGRGTLDMKQTVMATMESIERLLAEGVKPKRTVLLAFGHDEEVGGEAGAKAIVDLLEQRKTRALFSLDEGSAILDGVIPGATRPIAQIGLSEKGSVTLLLKARTKGGHSSMPPLQTAVGKIGRAVSRLEAHQMPATLDGPGGLGLRGVAPALPFGMRAALANQWLFSPILLRQLAASPVTNALIRTTTAPTI